MRSLGLSRTVVILGCVSFLNDSASEMITPLLPLFVTATLGAGPTIVGLIEGVAEATASILKLFSGWLADRGWAAKKLVLSGYTLSNATRPLIGLAASWFAVIGLRFLDRVGKGLRTAPRDAMIAAAAEPPMRGRAFGFHRSMDHAGAVVGPLLAFALLSAEVELRTVFYAAALPGLAVVLLIIFGLPGSKTHHQEIALPPRLSWRNMNARVRAMVTAAGVLALASVPEVFVVLWASEAGLDIVWVPLLWAAASLVKMSTAWPAGWSADRWGSMRLFGVGMAVRVLALLMLAVVPVADAGVWLLFVLYSFSLAITEPAERTIISEHADPAQRGTAFGFYHLASGLLLLPGAALFGWLWERWSSDVAFVTAACVSLVGAVMLAVLTHRRPAHVLSR